MLTKSAPTEVHSFHALHVSQGKMTGEGVKVLGDGGRLSGQFMDGKLHGWAEKVRGGGRVPELFIQGIYAL